MDASDAALAARVVATGDRDAFAQIVRRHQSQVRALVRKLASGDHALADDVAQETFVRAYRSMATYEGTAKLSTWLCRIAYHAFLDASARARATAKRETDAEDDARAPLAAEARALLRHDVERALACLSDGERAAIALTFGQDLTHEDAARILGCPLGSLKSTVARGLDKLERRLHAWRSTA